MFEFNANTALADILAAQQMLQRYEDARPRIIQKTAEYAADLVRERIQLRGQNANGEIMLSSSPRRTGRYSEQYGRERQQHGLQTDLIDLTFSGELLNTSWDALQIDTDEFGAGFRDDDMSQRAEHLEDRFGPIFRMSDDEQQASSDYFGDLYYNV